MSKKDEGGLFLSFPNQSQDFVLGFEAGLTYSKLIDEPEIIDTCSAFPVRVENSELYIGMGKKLGYDVSFEEVKADGASEQELMAMRKEWINIMFLQKRTK